MKKTLSFILALALVVSLFAGITVTASADYSGTGTFTKATGTLESGYYVFTYETATTTYPMSNDTSVNNWIKPGPDFDITYTVENPDPSIVWYYDASTGTINSAGDPTLFVNWPTTGNSAMPKPTATPVTITETSEGEYQIAVTATPERLLRYNPQGPGWRFYTSSTGNAEFTIYKLSDGETPAHEHNWSDWSSNGDGTHSRTCQGEDCPLGTQTENCSYTKTVVTAPTCVDEGEDRYVCDVCGYSYTQSVPATGKHVDADEDGVCDVCGEPMPEVLVYTLGTELNEGDQVVIWSVGGSKALSTAPSGTRLKGVNASIEGEELTVSDDTTAVLTVEYADLENFYLKTVDGKYLTTGATGNSLSFVDTADNYSIWNLTIHDASGKIVIINNLNAKYNGRAQAMEYYNNLFTTYGAGTTAAFQFQLYIHANESAHVHEWTGTETTAPTCTAKGVMTYTCSGCDESYTKDIPMIPHADADGDGLCDACQGKIYNQAESLNDGDRLIMVTGAFGAAMTGTESANGGYMAAAEVNAQAGVTVPVAEDNVWTVKTAEDGFYLLNSEGDYLYVNDSNHLALGDETSANILWIVAEPVEGLTATGAYLYNPGTEKYVEYSKNYNNYQTYSTPTASYETWYAFTFYTLPAEQASLEDGFYLLVGHGDDGWGVEFINPEQKFELNGSAQDEYLLSTTLAVGDEIKVVRVENNAITGWWPNGAGTQYHVDEAHSGNVTIYFKTDYVNDWWEFGGYFYIGSLLKPDTFADVYGCSISLKGNIALNFYVIPSEELLADANAYVTLGDKQVKFSEATTRVQGEDTLYQFTVSLHAKQMNDVVTLRVFDGEGNPAAMYRHSNNEDITETGYSYSVHEYIEAVRETSSDQKLIDLVNAMADYGVLAQLQFNYNTENLPQIQGDLDSVTTAELAAFEPQVTEGAATGVSYYGTSLVLESETVLRVYFTLDEGASIGDFTFKVGSKKYTPVEKDGKWYVEILNISAKDLDKLYTVTVSSAEGKVVTVKTSALSYACKVLNTDGTDEKLVNLVKGLYLYNQAANAYFG
jgi:hypothetical protein